MYPVPPRQPFDPDPPRRRNTLTIVVLAVGGVLLVLAGVATWFAVSSEGSSGESVTTSPVPTRGPVTRTETQAPRSVGPPAGATPCPSTYGTTGEFTTSAAGNSVTSCPFAESVRRAYAESGPVDQAPRTVMATSPVTGQSYAMTCAFQSGLVTCRGGNDALVYIY